MKGRYGVNRLEAFKYEAKQFLDGNKKYILIMVAIFVLALIIGIVIGSTTGIKRFNEDELIFGAWRFFARTLLMLLSVCNIFRSQFFVYRFILCHACRVGNFLWQVDVYSGGMPWFQRRVKSCFDIFAYMFFLLNICDDKPCIQRVAVSRDRVQGLAAA